MLERAPVINESFMDTIDFIQLVDNLKEKMSHKEIREATGIKKLKPKEMMALFEEAQALLNLHHEVCPESHTKEILLVNG